jgi:hypothetical protein
MQPKHPVITLDSASPCFRACSRFRVIAEIAIGSVFHRCSLGSVCCPLVTLAGAPAPRVRSSRLPRSTSRNFNDGAPLRRSTKPHPPDRATKSARNFPQYSLYSASVAPILTAPYRAATATSRLFVMGALVLRCPSRLPDQGPHAYRFRRRISRCRTRNSVRHHRCADYYLKQLTPA